MPIGPKGGKRPVDMNECAVMVAKIGLGEIEEVYAQKKRPVIVPNRKNGGDARAVAPTTNIFNSSPC